MSTKTTFKRVALVAVAALGLGVLSVAPSSATAGAVTFTTTAGSASVTQGAGFETTTAATVNITGLLSSNLDTYSVTVIQKSGTTANAFRLAVAETSTSVNSKILQSITTASTLAIANASVTAFGYRSASNVANSPVALFESTTATSAAYQIGATNASYVGATFGLLLDSTTARTAGTYVFTVLVQPFENGVIKANALQTTDLTFTITNSAAGAAVLATAAALLSGTVDPSKTTAILNAGAPTTFSTVDSAVAVVSTAAATNHASIQVKTFTADSDPTPESITATMTGAGVICNSDGSVCGKSLTITGATGNNTLRVRADGTAGTGSIVIKTTTVTFPAKSITFFAKAAKTITLAVNKPVIGIGSSTDVIRATATDADGNVWGGAAYIYAGSAASALIAGSATPAACTYNSAKGYHECSVSGTAKGTAGFIVIDAATVALATATSASADVRVSTGAATTAKISFDKATYGPGEKATVLITVLDADGLALPASAITAAFTAAPVSSSAFSTGSATLLADVTLQAATSSSSATTAGSHQYTVYMPMASGVVTLTATGSTGLALAGRVAISASAEVVNSSVDAATDAANEATDAANAATDAALAAADAADAATAAAQDASDAVAALSATVAKLVASLKAQITSLTNLVIKIQKKVKA